MEQTKASAEWRAYGFSASLENINLMLFNSGLMQNFEGGNEKQEFDFGRQWRNMNVGR